MIFNIEPTQLDSILMALALHKAVIESAHATLSHQAQAQLQPAAPEAPPATETAAHVDDAPAAQGPDGS